MSFCEKCGQRIENDELGCPSCDKKVAPQIPASPVESMPSATHTDAKKSPVSSKASMEMAEIAETIKLYKGLLDEEAITAEEFSAVKAKLLGLE